MKPSVIPPPLRLSSPRPGPFAQVDPRLNPAQAAATPDRPGRRACLGLGVLALTGCAVRPLSEPPSAPVSTTSASGAEAPLPAQVMPFSVATPGTQAPAGWRHYILRRDRPQTRYAVVRDGPRRVLHAHAAAAATGLQCPVSIEPVAGARLRFSWRVTQMHDDATVARGEVDDSPARIVLAFDGDDARLPLRERLFFDQVELFTGQRLPYATLMYVWDRHLPTESVIQNHRTSRIRYLTVEHGQARLGAWLAYERDVVADYRRAFGEAPRRISSVGVLTDSDALKHEQQAWYGDIEYLAPRAAG